MKSSNLILRKIEKKKLLIFDYDGTIADTNSLHEQAFNETLKFKDCNFEYEKIAGLKTIDVINIYLKENDINISKNEIYSLVNKKQRIFRAKIEKDLKPISGAINFINWAKSKYLIAVASSGSKLNVIKGLKSLGLFDYFALVLCAEDVKETKPSPEIFLKVLSNMNIKIEDALIFEDSIKGIEAAKNANIEFVDVRNYPFDKFLFSKNKNGY